MELYYVVGDREQSRHEAEGLAAEVLIEPGRYDVDTSVRHPLA
jgi:hypothetical protein